MLRLKNLLVLCAIVLGTAMGLQANTVPVGHLRVVAPCPAVGTLATLEHVGSCTIGDQTFRAFTFSGTGIGPSDLNYSAIDNDGKVGFSFGELFAGTGPGMSQDAQLGYLVTGPDITHAGVAITGFSFGGGPHNVPGGGRVTETICPGGLGCRSLNVNAGSFGGPGAAAASFPPVDKLAVSKFALVISPPTNGPGFTSMGFTDISQVPEPRTLLLFGTGLLLLSIIAHRNSLW